MNRELRLPTLFLSMLAFLLALFCHPFLERFDQTCRDVAMVVRYRLSRGGLSAAAELNAAPGETAQAAAADDDLISPEICLIGIDLPTLSQLGKYGSGDWVVRRPFLMMSPVLQRTFRPSVVAFDVFFDSVKGDRAAGGDPEDEQPPADAPAKPPASLPISAPFAQLAELSRQVAQQSEDYLAASFADLLYPDPGSGVEPLPVVCSYFLKDLSGEPGRDWHPDDIVVGSPDKQSEDNGLAIPYLRDVAIPTAQVRNVPTDYRFYHNGKLPAQPIRDYVQLGYINVPRDADGTIRRLPLILGFRYTSPHTGVSREVFVPSLALLSVLIHWELTPANVVVDFGRAVTIRRRDGTVVRIPIDTAGCMVLNYVGKMTDFRSVSLYPFLAAGYQPPGLADGEADATAAARRETIAQTVNGTIALVGLTASGTTDIGPTPIDPNTPYVHVHTTAINSILTGKFIRPISDPKALALFGLLFCMFSLFCCSGSVSRMTYGTLGFLVFLFACFYLLIHFHAYLLPVVTPTLYLGAAYLAILAFRYFAEERAKHRIRTMFSTMVSPHVLQFMEENPESFSLSGNRVDATVMFSDLRHFTTIAERLRPEQLSDLLNRYFSAMTEVIMGHGGYVDKFEGDAIMAEWGVPYPRLDHAAAGCLAVLAQVTAMGALQRELHETFGIELNVRFGLGSGLLSAGNMGSNQRFQYTVMGNVVNEAARLEPANKDYGTTAIITERTFEAAGDVVEARLLDRIMVTGKTEPVTIYELLCHKGNLRGRRQAMVHLYEEALRKHWGFQWGVAEALLNDALALVPDDKPSTRLLAIVRRYAESPPPDDWDGVYRRTQKD